MPCVDNKRMLHMHMASVERCPASSTVSVFCCCHKLPHHSVSLSTRVLVTNSMQCHDMTQCTLGCPPLILSCIPLVDTFLMAYSRDTASVSVATKLHLLRQVANNGYMQVVPVPEQGGEGWGGVGRGGEGWESRWVGGVGE